MHPLWRLTRGLTLGVRAIVVDEDRRVLLVEHTYVKGWHLPGGGIERGETAADSAVRELEEEAAVAVETTPELFGLYANFANMDRDHIAVFLIRKWHFLDRSRPRLEIARTGLFSLDALPEATTNGTRRRLAELFDNQEKSPAW